MKTVSSFPLLSKSEFDEACGNIAKVFIQEFHGSNVWASADVVQRNGSQYLKIVKELSIPHIDPGNGCTNAEEEEIEDEDEEILEPPSNHGVTVEYDIVLSPSYQVPVLYFSIKDPLFRYPPTMDTLYRILIPPQFKAQAENVSVIGGITVTDHPVTNTPVFFIHPCQTASVLEASKAIDTLTSIDYLVLWIGAMGKCVGLDIPVALAQNLG
ncbi:hypothetical protein K504DRAFT_432890 [Pleomassaria siparia CBS 279.74]|uniref:Ubiquitin-like-conjugating enzyme ATG10 n=1 Tax=Pleomassaria siparia CBS 279.74 TaxID=1314801 RepID=A0A6G1K7Z2_9PLEO|nr:hypothetical protein K504DRAFT_432890 [Pleomassaria siparia CBS 279.74]